jgi:ABC-2 type transport system permease protein
MISRRRPLAEGLRRHLVLTLALNFRSKQAIVYGYAMPLLFLAGFAGIFRTDIPPLSHEMGQLLTIGVLGSACFGMPTAMVAERERGVWRRYRLLPAAASSLVASTVAARFLLLLSSALLQVAFAHLAFGTPLPGHPGQLLLAFAFAAYAFLGLGLLIAGLADSVPAVQALAQCVFLPMIMIGGVGVPLAVLPRWAQWGAGFLPGRYSVEVLSPFFSGQGLHGQAFGLTALLVTGSGAVIAGSRLFRWNAGQRTGRIAWAWIAFALAAWVAVGLAAASTGRLKPPPALGGPDPAEAITESQIDAIGYDGLPRDNDVVTPLAPPSRGFGGSQRMDEFTAKLEAWPPGRRASVSQDVRNLVSVAAIADLEHDPMEDAVARAVLDRLQAGFDRHQLSHALAWVALYPADGTVVATAQDLDLPGVLQEGAVRDRDALYARKFLGRVLGKIPD